jgi:uncharacterized membrane protein YraQ (UPF0718 family)
MKTTVWILAIIVGGLLIIAYLRERHLPIDGLIAGGQSLWRNLAVLLLGFAIAGLAQVLIPKELITSWIGQDSGFKGILIRCVLGGLIPGAPYATFPLIAVLYQNGASMGAIVGFVSAWGLWSISRLPVEIALIDPKPALIRYAITFVVPPLAGLTAEIIRV